MSKKIGFYEKINEISENLLNLKEKLDNVAVDFLKDDEKIEYYRIMNLIDFYIATILELVMEENKSFIAENKEYVRDIIKNIEEFIIAVNDNLTI
jgi:ribulose 1,5-bisphosphate carboxylase large subunit-like protein